MATIYDRINAALSTLGKRSRPTEGEAEERQEQEANGQPRQHQRRGSSSGDGTQKQPRQQLSFRPADQAELHRRLETFKPLAWFGKPEAASAVECALHGWTNCGRDMLVCEFCNVHLKYPQNVDIDSRQTTADLFAEQLVAKHAGHCPWKKTTCSRSLLYFQPPTGAEQKLELQRQYEQRYGRLQGVDLLPDATADALQAVLQSCPEAFQKVVLQGRDAESAAAVKLTNPERARLLALLGWDMEVLAPSSSAAGVGSSGTPSRPSPAHYSLLHLTGVKRQKQLPSSPLSPGPSQAAAPQQVSSADVALVCPCCKARVGLWNFTGSKTAPIGRVTKADPGTPAAAAAAAALLAAAAATPLPAEAEEAAAGAAAAPGVPIAAALSMTIAGGTFGSSLRSSSLAASSPGPFGKQQQEQQQQQAPIFGRPGRTQAALPASPAPAAAAAGTSGSGSSSLLKRKLPESTPPATPNEKLLGAFSGAAAATPGSSKRPRTGTPAAAAAAAAGSSPLMSAAFGMLNPWRKQEQAAAAASPAPGATPAAAAAAAACFPPSDAFDALGYHRSWCPWVFMEQQQQQQEGQQQQGAGMQAAAAPGAAGVAPAASHRASGWVYLLQLLAGFSQDTGTMAADSAAAVHAVIEVPPAAGSKGAAAGKLLEGTPGAAKTLPTAASDGSGSGVQAVVQGIREALRK